MDIQSIIIGIVIVGLCFLPFIYSTIKNKKKNEQFLKILLDKAKQLNCTLTQHEADGNIVLGLDETNHTLFFLKKLKDGNECLRYVNLTEIKSARIYNESRPVGSGDSGQKVTDKLQLIFSYYDSTKDDVVFEFYNSDETLIMNGELQLIDKWLIIAKEQIKSKPLTKTFA